MTTKLEKLRPYGRFVAAALYVIPLALFFYALVDAPRDRETMDAEDKFFFLTVVVNSALSAAAYGLRVPAAFAGTPHILVAILHLAAIGGLFEAVAPHNRNDAPFIIFFVGLCISGAIAGIIGFKALRAAGGGGVDPRKIAISIGGAVLLAGGLYGVVLSPAHLSAKAQAEIVDDFKADLEEGTDNVKMAAVDAEGAFADATARIKQAVLEPINGRPFPFDYREFKSWIW